ncbi:inositol monophosphatase family protein [Nitratifractor salsuginis]|uniref:Inositol-1-monophosphatase n=1 Tax=Nitratifractor salsuginis (strain DSM 16511 / JCM 12458 / E9I37-1) TaxID=749222 RepID=E6X3B3_NITSE|nr:inositol monophosphatase family protein [Nitratifractor salsuginis]ADV47326.1 inositol monophosphatase [Nitratifractor salsuginis DSM 16511]
MSDIKLLKLIAREAGEIVRRGYHSHKEIHHKGVVDLVTQYDVETERFLLDALSEAFPDHTLVGEESYTGSWDLERAIYIDPIDGTTNFVHGIPHLAVSLGVWEGGEATMAVVYNPILDELYWAERGRGAWLGEEQLRVSEDQTLQNALIATGFPYAKVNRGAEYRWVVDAIAEILPRIQDLRRLGSAACDLSYLARGIFAAFYEINLKPWDVAAGILLVQEAGGRVSNLAGEPYRFGDRGIVTGTPAIHRALLEALPPYI